MSTLPAVWARIWASKLLRWIISETPQTSRAKATGMPRNMAPHRETRKTVTVMGRFSGFGSGRGVSAGASEGVVEVGAHFLFGHPSAEKPVEGANEQEAHADAADEQGHVDDADRDAGHRGDVGQNASGRAKLSATDG